MTNWLDNADIQSRIPEPTRYAVSSPFSGMPMRGGGKPPTPDELPQVTSRQLPEDDSMDAIGSLGLGGF